MCHTVGFAFEASDINDLTMAIIYGFLKKNGNHLWGFLMCIYHHNRLTHASILLFFLVSWLEIREKELGQ
jgi:hypothetical protein